MTVLVSLELISLLCLLQLTAKMSTYYPTHFLKMTSFILVSLNQDLSYLSNSEKPDQRLNQGLQIQVVNLQHNLHQEI